MHRSASWTRNSDDYYMQSPPLASKLLRMQSDANELPSYNPTIDVPKKEKHHSKLSENAVHVIPFVLILCGFILWFFSNPDVELSTLTKGDSIASKIEGLTIEGDIETDSDGTQTGFLPVDVEDLSKSNQAGRNRKLAYWQH